jgi:thermitase
LKALKYSRSIQDFANRFVHGNPDVSFLFNLPGIGHSSAVPYRLLLHHKGRFMKVSFFGPKRVFLLAWSFIILGGSAQLKAGASAPGDAVPGEVLVRMVPSAGGNRAVTAIEASVGTVTGSEPALNAYRVQLGNGVSMDAALAQLRARQDVVYAEPNYIVHAYATPNDPSYNSQWGPQKAQADAAWSIYNPQGKVVLAIVDTGIDYTHPDLSDVLYRDGAGTVIGHNVQTGSSSGQDDEGHGTHCAGIAAAHVNNGVGIAGIAGWNPAVQGSDSFVKLMPVKVLDSTGSGTDANVSSGIIWAADHGANVISLSLGGPDYSNTLNDAIQYAWNKGCVIAAAAGNDGTSAYSYPGANTNVISVAATDSNDRLTSFSNYGSWVKVAAPGLNIYSTFLGGGYQTLSGTSMATPHVAGEAALLMAQNRQLTNSQISSLITGNVDTVGAYSTHTLGTAGRINVYRALQQAGGNSSNIGSLTFNWYSTYGGDTITATASLAAAAPAGGTTLQVSSGNSSVAGVPTQVSVAAGSTSVTFSVKTTAVVSEVDVSITVGTGSASVSKTLRVLPAVPDSITFNPWEVRGGNGATATLTLNGVAPVGGVSVSLTSENANVLQVQSSVYVPAGQNSVTFPITTSAVNASTLGVVDAYANGVSIRIGLTVNPAAPESIVFNPWVVLGGNSATATLTINGKAPAGGLTVNLLSENSAVLQVQSSVFVPAGQSSVTFPVTTSGVSQSTLGVVDAGTPGGSIRIGLTINPAMPGNLVFDQNPAKGGSVVTAKVVLNGVAPAGGLLVTLASEDTSLATVPASVTVPAGAKEATFAVSTKPVTAATMVVIDASFGRSGVRIGLYLKP